MYLKSMAQDGDREILTFQDLKAILKTAFIILSKIKKSRPFLWKLEKL